MKIRTGFVSNSSSSSFVVYHFIGMPKEKKIDQLYDEVIPEKKVNLREHINWGKITGDLTSKLDKESAITEVRNLIGKFEENSDDKALNERVEKAITTMVKRDNWRYNDFITRFDGKNHSKLEMDNNFEKLRRMFPLVNKSEGEALLDFYKEFDEKRIVFVKDSYDIDDNNFIGRDARLMEKDGEYFIDGKNAPVDMLFPNCKITSVNWCVWSNQNSIDEDFFDELDPPSPEQIETIYDIQEKALVELGLELGVFTNPINEYLIDIFKAVDDISVDGCSEEMLNAVKDLVLAIKSKYSLP